MGWNEFWSTVYRDSLTFGADVLGHLLSWPVVVLVIVLILLKPIRKLIGRVKNAKGLGGELEFGMEEVERATDEAIEEATAPAASLPASPKLEPAATDTSDGGEPSDDDATPRPVPPAQEPRAQGSRLSALLRYVDSEDGGAVLERTPNPFYTRITLDPSGAIIGAWERLLAVLVEVNMKLRGGPGRPTRQPRKLIEDLRKSGHVTESFIESVESLYKVRNEVAHGEAVPSPGVARTYVQRAYMIEDIARTLILDEDEPRPGD